MTWFEAYVLWSLDMIGFCFLAVFLMSGIATAFYIAFTLDEDDKPKKRIWVTGVVVSAVCFILFIAIPSTGTLLKIIATKKGVDAIQSGTAQNYLSEADKAITNGLKVLNQEIDKKLDKKGKAE